MTFTTLFTAPATQDSASGSLPITTVIASCAGAANTTATGASKLLNDNFIFALMCALIFTFAFGIWAFVSLYNMYSELSEELSHLATAQDVLTGQIAHQNNLNRDLAGQLRDMRDNPELADAHHALAEKVETLGRSFDCLEVWAKGCDPIIPDLMDRMVDVEDKVNELEERLDDLVRGFGGMNLGGERG